MRYAHVRFAVLALAAGLSYLGLAGDAGAYTLDLKVTDSSLLAGPNALAADAAGQMFALRATRESGGALSNERADVEELSPAGVILRRFTTTFTSGGHTFFLRPTGIAVTPAGGRVLVVASASTDPGGGGAHPLLASYNADTGKLIEAVTFDQRDGTLPAGIAVTPDGAHVYVASTSTSLSVDNYVFEYSVAPLQRVRKLRFIDGNPSALAVTAGTLAVNYGAPAHTSSDIDFLSLSFGFGSHTTSPGGGLALDWQGDAIAGDPGSKQLAIFNSVGVPVESFGAGNFHGIPYAEATDAANDVFAYDGAGPVVNSNPTATGVILRYRPKIVPVHFTRVPPKRLPRPGAQFSWSTFAAPPFTVECRLETVGKQAPAFGDCPSGGAILPNLRNGVTYVFQVRTISSEGGTGDPLSYRFKVVLPVPHASIVEHPPKSGTEHTAVFKFNSTIHGSRFKCRLFRPGSPLALFVRCKSPARYKHLTAGMYVFQVEAISSFGIVQPTPTSWHFAVTGPLTTGH